MGVTNRAPAKHALPIKALDLTLSAPQVARSLVGCELTFCDRRGCRGGIIIEAEAYTSNDPASHSYNGPTSRNAAMFMSPGTIYIYQIYGIHHCLNVVCGDGDGQAVLIRALRPTRGIASMRHNRDSSDDTKLCSGPANLVQALGITRDLDRKHMSECHITIEPSKSSIEVVSKLRVGIRKATDKPWRFVMSEND